MPACEADDSLMVLQWTARPTTSQPGDRLLQLALPVTVPAIAALAISQFLVAWNDPPAALVYIRAEH